MRMIYILLGFWSPFLLVAQQNIWSLQECINHALQNDIAIQQANLSEYITNQNTKNSYGELLPSIGVYVAHDYQFGSTINPSSNTRESANFLIDRAGLNAEIDIFNWGKILRIKSAKLKSEKAAYDTHIKKNELIIKITQAFFQYQYDSEQLEVTNRFFLNSNILLERIEKEVFAGNKPKSDLYDIQSDVEKIKVKQIRDNSSVVVAKQNLLKLLVIRQDSINFSLDKILLDAPNESLTINQIIKESEMNHPEIRSAEKEVEIAHKSVQQARSGHLPTLQANYQISSFFSNQIGSNQKNGIAIEQFKNNKNQNISLGLTIPIFQQLKVRRKKNEAKIKLDQSVLSFNQSKNELYHTLQSALTKVKNSYQTFIALDHSLEIQKLAFDKNEQKYINGTLEPFSYFTAKRDLFNTQFEFIKAKYEYIYHCFLLNFYRTNKIG